jgi:O-antigen/teichoic acid export membrane protein
VFHHTLTQWQRTLQQLKIVIRIYPWHTAKNFFLYASGALALRGISALCIPIVTRILSPDEYGLLSLCNSFMNVVVIIAGLGLRQVFYLEFFHKSSGERKTMFNSIMLIYLLTTFPLFLAAFTHTATINNYFFCNKASYTLIVATLIICFISFFTELFYQALSLHGKPILLIMTQFTVAAVIAITNIILLYYAHLGVLSTQLAVIVGLICSASCALYLYIKNGYAQHLDLSDARTNAKNYLALGFPFIPSLLFGWILSAGGRWMLANYSSMADVGIYAIADSFGYLYQIVVISSVSVIYLPMLLKKFAEQPHNIAILEQTNKKIMFSTMASATILLIAGLSTGKPLLYWILPKHYHASITYILPLLMGYVLWTGAHFMLGVIQFFKKTYLHLITLCIPTMLNIALNMLLVPTYGIDGCVYATIISYGAYFLMVYAVNHRLVQEMCNSNTTNSDGSTT